MLPEEVSAEVVPFVCACDASNGSTALRLQWDSLVGRLLAVWKIAWLQASPYGVRGT